MALASTASCAQNPLVSVSIDESLTYTSLTTLTTGGLTYVVVATTVDLRSAGNWNIAVSSTISFSSLTSGSAQLVLDPEFTGDNTILAGSGTLLAALDPYSTTFSLSGVAADVGRGLHVLAVVATPSGGNTTIAAESVQTITGTAVLGIPACCAGGVPVGCGPACAPISVGGFDILEEPVTVDDPSDDVWYALNTVELNLSQAGAWQLFAQGNLQLDTESPESATLYLLVDPTFTTPTTLEANTGVQVGLAVNVGANETQGTYGDIPIGRGVHTVVLAALVSSGDTVDLLNSNLHTFAVLSIPTLCTPCSSYGCTPCAPALPLTSVASAVSIDSVTVTFGSGNRLVLLQTTLDLRGAGGWNVAVNGNALVSDVSGEFGGGTVALIVDPELVVVDGETFVVNSSGVVLGTVAFGATGTVTVNAIDVNLARGEHTFVLAASTNVDEETAQVSDANLSALAVLALPTCGC